MSCQSVKSRVMNFEKCCRKAEGDSIFCKQHSKQKRPLVYVPGTLNPLMSENDSDPVSMETIYTVDTEGKRTLATKATMFTYMMEAGGKKYQRTLLLTTIRDLLRNNILVDPFSNVPFTSDVITRAREAVCHAPRNKAMSKKEEQNIRFNRIIDYFQTIGYIIQPRMISEKSRGFYTSWYNEVIRLWTDFRLHNMTVAPYIFPSPNLTMIDYHLGRSEVVKNVTVNLLDFMSRSSQGIMIVLSALAWVCEEVCATYPDLVSV